uniref:Uncharacterized protein n=1 Tax=Knipowitschia caucasica TaxID=637954 RepID=A0AAV2LYK6_KNICA
MDSRNVAKRKKPRAASGKECLYERRIKKQTMEAQPHAWKSPTCLQQVSNALQAMQMQLYKRCSGVILSADARLFCYWSLRAWARGLTPEPPRHIP